MQNEASQNRIRTICLVVIATAIVTYLIYWLRPVLLPFVVALFVVSGITPVLEILEKRLNVNRIVAAGITFLLGLAGLFVLGVCLWLSALQLADRGQAYRDRVSQLVADVTGWFEPTVYQLDQTGSETGEFGEASTLAGSVESQGGRGEAIDRGIATTGTNGKPNSIEQNVQRVRGAMDVFLRDSVAKISAELLGLISTSMIVLIYVFFLLAGAENVSSGGGAFVKINEQVRSYLLLKTLISIMTGAAFGFVLWLFGVPMAIAFGMLAFLLNYIPNVGPIVASMLPIPFILLDPSGSIWWMSVVIGLTCGIQIISGNVIEPKLMGQSSNLHPVVILLALMFWGMMWGITGMFLATPITAAIKIVLDGFDSARPVSNLLAGNWQEMARAHEKARNPIA